MANHNRYVAHFDMLGMKSAVCRDADEAWRALSALNAAKHRILSLGIQLKSTKETIQDRVHAFICSDTVMLFSLSNEPQDIWAITTLAAHLFSFSLTSCVPLRGAISHGEFMFNEQESLFLGPALVEAYTLCEQSQWLGIAVSQKTAEDIHAISMRVGPYQHAPAVLQWDVPLRKGSQRQWVINWPVMFAANFTERAPISVEQFYQAFVRLFGAFDSLREQDRRKYFNTVEFINERLACRDGLQ